MLEFLLLCAGLAGLWVGSELMIGAAISLADRFRVSDAVIGMMILAVGTDLPELFITVDASLYSLRGEEDMSGIVLGSAIGSSIGQFCLVIGIAGFIGYSPRPLRLMTRSATFLLGSLAALALFFLDGSLSSGEGWVLIGWYAFYLTTLILWPTRSDTGDAPHPDYSLLKDVALLSTGLVVLLIAAEITVVYTDRFAELVQLSNMTVSTVIIGLGSSLPELTVSITALLKKRGGLSVGNLMGSNILDTSLVPGVGAVMFPLTVPAAVLSFDLPVLALVTILVLGFLYVSPRGIKWPEASLLLLIYVGYVSLRLAG